MINRLRSTGRATLIAAFLFVSACAGMAGWEEILTQPGMRGDVRGEVDRIDQREREIRVLSGWGRATLVSYDGRTEVVGRERRYPVSSLRRGDEVSMRVQQDRRGELYTDRIYLEREDYSRSEGTYPGERTDRRRDRVVERLAGQVAAVDERGGRFELRTGQRLDFIVIVPADAPSRVRKRFHDLRRGEYVRVEGRMLNGRHLTLHRFVR